MADMSLVSDGRCRQATHYPGSPPSFARLYHVTSPNSRPLYHPCTPPTSATFPTPSDSCLGSLPYFHGWMFDPRSPASSSDVLSSTDSGLRGGSGDHGSVLKTDSYGGCTTGAAVADTPFVDYTSFSALLPQTEGSDGGGGGGGQVRVRCVKRRVSANRKERRRTHSINSAFSALRGCIPNVPSDTKLSKIKTLRLATSYIAYLMDILNKDDPQLTNGGFKAEISKKIESREEKRRRESEEILKASGRPDKPAKGRTGWPQQVWAAELKQ